MNRALALFVVPESDPQQGPSSTNVPMLGKHYVGINKSQDGPKPPDLSFHPQFPLRPGTKYRAKFNPAELAKIASIDPSTLKHLSLDPIELEFTTPALEPSPPTTVSAIYPTTDTLPENQLKFYIHFSAPMTRGEAYQHVRLEKASGEEVPVPFLELSEELWDLDTRRFTLFFEPGRVKRGVMLRDEIGPALVAGEEYALVIDGNWRDANGNPLGDDFRKKFHTAPQDVTQPDPHEWKIASPHANSRDPLVIDFNEPLDHALLQRVITVQNPTGAEVLGKIQIDQNETRWSFTPDTPWQSGNHELIIAGILEDLAGNSIGRKFEVEMKNKDREVPTEARIRLNIE